MALMAILLAHEMGHYLVAKRYVINASPPYFLPAPIEVNFIGTFGAFIRLRSPVVDRRQLMDVGAAGPWVGFGVALLLLIVGMQLSWPAAPGMYDGPMIIQLANAKLVAGDALITWGIRHAFVGDAAVVLHPIAVAGWIGMLVTALNLLPLGQLDGGHILYALLGRRQQVAAVITWLGLVVLGQWFWPWWIWAVLTLVLGGGRLAHPRVLEPRRPLPRSRLPLGWASLGLLIATFAPIPISF
jgi:membrane-associated protease RseP (regulator of RpoE activity)